MKTITRGQKRDIRLLARFVRLYCAGRHGASGRTNVAIPTGSGTVQLCADCAQLLAYAVEKRLACPLEERKPSCRSCRIHCYAEQERGKIREVMSYAGKRMIIGGRLDYLRYFLF